MCPSDGLEFFDCDVLVGATLRAAVPGLDAQGVVAEMDRCGISRALIYGSSPAPDAFECQNRVARQAEAAQPRLCTCAVMPQFPAWRGQKVKAMLNELLEGGQRCFRLDHEIGPAAGPLELEDFVDAAACWRLLARNHIPVFIPGGHLPCRDKNFGYEVREVVALCRRYPTLPVVLLNCSYTIERQLYLALTACANLHIAVTRLGLFGQLESLVASFGPSRFLFGSGLPWNDPAIPRGTVAFAALPLRQRQLIAGGNLTRLLRCR